jgi:hypothetical protein
LETDENPERGLDDDAEIEYVLGEPVVLEYGIVNEVADVVTSLTVFILIATSLTVTEIIEAILSHPLAFL